MLSDILLLSALILIAFKFGLRTRLREIGRVIDRLVNLLLGLIIGAYVVQLLWLVTFGRN